MFRVLLIFACCAVSTAARAYSCAGNPDALGTERALAVDTALSARVGRKQFSGTTLPLAPKEVVFTFYHPNGARHPQGRIRAGDVLSARAHNAIANPELGRREHNEGHTIAYHTYGPPLA